MRIAHFAWGLIVLALSAYSINCYYKHFPLDRSGELVGMQEKVAMETIITAIEIGIRENIMEFSFHETDSGYELELTDEILAEMEKRKLIALDANSKKLVSQFGDLGLVKSGLELKIVAVKEFSKDSLDISGNH